MMFNEYVRLAVATISVSLCSLLPSLAQDASDPNQYLDKPYATLPVSVEMTNVVEGIGAVAVQCHLKWEPDPGHTPFTFVAKGTTMIVRPDLWPGDLSTPGNETIVEGPASFSPGYTKAVEVSIYGIKGQYPDMWTTGACWLTFFDDKVDINQPDVWNLSGSHVIEIENCDKGVPPGGLPGCIALGKWAPFDGAKSFERPGLQKSGG